MSDHVVRLSGSQTYSNVSVKNLISYLGSNNDRKFIVISALNSIKAAIGYAVDNIGETDTDKFSNNLLSEFSLKTGKAAPPSYLNLVEQIKAIITGIKLIGDYSKSLKDQIDCFSEKLTAEIFRMQFCSEGINSEVLWPEQMGLLSTDDFGNATFLSVNKGYCSGLPAGFYLIPGSYGITEHGKLSRAGTSAADYTAAFLTKALKTGKLELWGIDQGFTRADPRIVTKASKISRLTYSEASELAYFDHVSFHPRTVEPLEHDHIPVVIMDTNSGNGKTDTLINTETFVEKQIVKGVACSDDVSLLGLNGPGVGLKPGILAKVTSRLNEAGINIRSVITSQISINLILERGTGKQAYALVRQLGFSSVKEISLNDDVALIGIVGHGMQQNYGVSARIFNAVAQHRINVVLSGSGASDLVSYLIVKSSDKEKSVREIYSAFFNTPNP